jgi:hypothetical protein
MMSEKAAVWSVAQAKARFNEVVDRALKEGPQTITLSRQHATCGFACCPTRRDIIGDARR